MFCQIFFSPQVKRSVIISNTQQFCQCYQKAAEKLSFSRSALFHVRTRICLNYIVHDCRLNHSFIDPELQIYLQIS